jgi:hypothetical protein
MCFNFWKKQKAYAGDRAKAIMHAGERMSLRKELIITFHILAVLE